MNRAAETARDLAREWWRLPLRLRAKRFPSVLARTLRAIEDQWSASLALEGSRDPGEDSPVSCVEIVSALVTLNAPRALIRFVRALEAARVNVTRPVTALTAMVRSKSDRSIRRRVSESVKPTSAAQVRAIERVGRIRTLALRVESTILDFGIDGYTLPADSRALHGATESECRAVVTRLRSMGLADHAAAVRAHIRAVWSGAVARLTRAIDDLSAETRRVSARPVSAVAVATVAPTHSMGAQWCDDRFTGVDAVCSASPIRTRCRKVAQK